MAIALAGDPVCCSSTSRPPASTRRRGTGLAGGPRSRGAGQDGAAHHALHGRGAALADRVAIMAQGRSSPTGAGQPGRPGQRPRDASLHLPPGVVPPTAVPVTISADGRVAFVPDDPTAVLHDLTGWALATGVGLTRLAVSRPSLEDVYLQLAGSPDGPPATSHRRSRRGAAPSPGAGGERRAGRGAGRGRTAQRRPAHRAPGPLRAALVLAQPAERVLHLRVPGRHHRDLRGGVRQRPAGHVLLRAHRAAVLPADDHRAVRAGCRYSQLAITLAFRRQDGILKRVRARRCPPGCTSSGWSPTASSSASSSRADRRRRRAVRLRGRPTAA